MDKVLETLKEDYTLRASMKRKHLKVQDELEDEIDDLEQSLITSKIIPELEQYAKTLLNDLECEVYLAIKKDANGDVVVNDEQPIQHQFGISDNSHEMDSWTPSFPNLFTGLTPIEEEDMPRNYELHWILSGDIQGLIPLIRSNGKYGLFRASFMGMGMEVNKFYSIQNPFRFDDVRISVPSPGYEYYGYLATLEKNEWAVWLIRTDCHPLKMVEGCKSFNEAKRRMEAIIGPSPYPWTTFDDYGHGDLELSEASDAHNPNADLIVTFPDGTVFDDDKAISTFVKTIQKIGFDKVANVGIMLKRYNLVDTRQRTVNGRTWQKKVGKYYVYAHLSNDDKIKYLNQINNYYNLGLKIEKR